jgi:hypothetical protein
MMNKVYIVAGDNGLGNSGNCVFGLYPTEVLAEARLARLEELFKEGEDGAEHMYIQTVEVGPEGADCHLYISG